MILKPKFLFFHGGPGLNNYCEEAVLKPLLARQNISAEFWNQPSKQRPWGDPYDPNRPFENWLESAEKFLIKNVEPGYALYLVGHSFSVNPVRMIAEKHLNLISGLIFLTPGFNLHDVQKNILKLAQKDYQHIDPPVVEKLQELLNSTQRTFDEPIAEGFRLALDDPKLLTHYWVSPEKMNYYMSFLNPSRGAQFDLDALYDVLGAYGKKIDSISFHPGLPIPVKIVFGKKDPIVSRELETQIANQSFKIVEAKTFSESGHYPHLEQPEKFVQILLQLVRESQK